jgi:hypothetical protein
LHHSWLWFTLYIYFCHILWTCKFIIWQLTWLYSFQFFIFIINVFLVNWIKGVSCFHDCLMQEIIFCSKYKWNFFKQLPVSKLNKKPYCTTLKCAHMDQLYNNFTSNQSWGYVHFTSRTYNSLIYRWILIIYTSN